MPDPLKLNHRSLMRVIMAVFYLAAGVLHIMAPAGFLLIMPTFVPWPEMIVFMTGVCEIAGSIGLLVPRFRQVAGAGLAVYAVCVLPANINHAWHMISVGGLPDSWWYHGPRLAFQPVLVWWALYCAGIIRWPFRRGAAAV